MSPNDERPNAVTQDELIELQSRLSFQDDTIGQLNTIVARQDRQLQALAKQLQGLVSKFDDAMANREPGEALQDERPPHY